MADGRRALVGSEQLEHTVQHAAEALLVDPKFKEQFEIAHPTERYTELLAALPDFFVGTENRLITLVELLCSEMSAAFQTTGSVQPLRASSLQPWHLLSVKESRPFLDRHTLLVMGDVTSGVACV